MSKLEQLKQDILELESTYNDSDTPDNVKELLKPSIDKAKKQLAELEKETKPVEKKAEKKSIVEKYKPSAKKETKPAKKGSKEVTVSKALEIAKKYRSEQGLSTKDSDIERDAKRGSKPAGKRVSENGNVYYENRENRSDRHTAKYPKLEHGGRTTSAINKDRAYQSEESWEQNYDRKTNPKHPKYDKFEAGGNVNYNYLDNTVKRYRILKPDMRIKYAGTDSPSWFFSLDEAKKHVDYSKGEMIYEYDINGDRLWEVLADGGKIPNWLFIGTYPAARVYSDRRKESHGDYHKIGIVQYNPLKVNVYDKDPKYADVVKMMEEDMEQMRKDGYVQTSYTGQTAKVSEMPKVDIDIDKFEAGGKTDTTIATEILNQLGGMGKLKMMTGAYNFVAYPSGVSFKLKNPSANYVKITLNGLDLYDLEVGRIRGIKYTILHKDENLYNDMLKPAIEEATGMYLSLFKEGGMTNYNKKWKVTMLTMQGQKIEKTITLGRMSDKEDVKQAIKRMAGPSGIGNIKEILSIIEIHEDGGMMGDATNDFRFDITSPAFSHGGGVNYDGSVFSIVLNEAKTKSYDDFSAWYIPRLVIHNRETEKKIKETLNLPDKADILQVYNAARGYNVDAFAKGGMISHGFQSGDIIYEIYKGFGIIEAPNDHSKLKESYGSDVVVINPNSGERYIIEKQAANFKQAVDKARTWINDRIYNKGYEMDAKYADVHYGYTNMAHPKYAAGGAMDSQIKWQDATEGDSALVKSENKMGIIVKAYGRKFHLQFVDGTQKTYDASELEFYDFEKFAAGGAVDKPTAKTYEGWGLTPYQKQNTLYTGIHIHKAPNGTKIELVPMHDSTSSTGMTYAITINGRGIWATNDRDAAKEFYLEEIKKYHQKYEHGGAVSSKDKFIKDMRHLKDQIHMVQLEDGTLISGKDLRYAKGGSVDAGNPKANSFLHYIYPQLHDALKELGLMLTPEYSISDGGTKYYEPQAMAVISEKGVTDVSISYPEINGGIALNVSDMTAIVSFPEADINGEIVEINKYAKGGIVVTKISDIPNLKDKVIGGKVTYRGLGMGDLSNKFYEIAGENGYKIKVDGKEYYITETDFDEINKNHDIKFAAPSRKYADGGSLAERTTIEVGDEEIAVIIGKKERKGYPVYISTVGYAPITHNLYPTKEKAISTAKSIAKRNGYALRYAEGGVTFSDKVKAVSKKLTGSKVVSKYKSKYGAKYSPAEAKEAATKIVGAMVAKSGEMAKKGGRKAKSAISKGASSIINKYKPKK
jgi:hypothetical protein